MRDIALFFIVFAALPFALRKPWIGVILWVWLSVMNPHRQTWGIAWSFPFAAVVAVTTLLGILLTSDPRRMKGGSAAMTLLIFVGWMTFTTAFALEPGPAQIQLERVLKIQLFTFIALLVLHRREHVNWLMAILVLSIGYYGVKGGLFTLTTFGNYRVWGPEESFFFDNNAVGLAIVMTIPLWIYLRIIATRQWIKHLISAAVVLSLFGIVGSQSRGALIAVLAMATFLWLKGRNKLPMLVGFVMLGAAVVAFMPESWESRMRSIGTYEDDSSAMSRINTWIMMFNLALDRPIVGGGFEPYSWETLARYNPDFNKVFSAHSIYFQVLGEHGFVGFALFVTFWALTWRMASGIIRSTRERPSEAWAYWLAKMIQVSLIGYVAGGAFLNMAYWDVPYYLMVALAVTVNVLRDTSGLTDPAMSTKDGLGRNTG